MGYVVNKVELGQVSLQVPLFCGPGSSAGIATGCGLDGSGIESLWGRDFSALVQTGFGVSRLSREQRAAGA